MAWTRTGTISLTNGQVKVYGSGTPWVSNGKTRPGDALLAPDGKVYEIASIESNTELTLTDAYLGATASGQAYKIQHLGLLPAELAVGISDLQSKYLTTIAQLYEWETSEAATVPITNPATGETVNVKPLKRFLSALGDGSMAGSFTDLVASGNVGVGAWPSAWSSGFRALDVRTTSIYDVLGSEGGLVFNAYIESGDWKYKGSGGTASACLYRQTVDRHSWYTAPSGTAGQPVSFSQAMTLDNYGMLGVGRDNPVPGAASFLTVLAYGGNRFGVTIANASSSSTNFLSFINNSDSIIGSVTQIGTTSVAYYTTSDYRIKLNVRPADANRFMEIEFVDYETIDGRHECGVIAHNFQGLYPSLVIGEKDATEIRTIEIAPAVTEQRLFAEAVLDENGVEITPAQYETVEIQPAVTEEREFPVYQQVNYIGLIPRIGVKVQQHERRIEDLESKLEAALARIDALESLLPS